MIALTTKTIIARHSFIACITAAVLTFLNCRRVDQFFDRQGMLEVLDNGVTRRHPLRQNIDQRSNLWEVPSLHNRLIAASRHVNADLLHSFYWRPSDRVAIRRKHLDEVSEHRPLDAVNLATWYTSLGRVSDHLLELIEVRVLRFLHDGLERRIVPQYPPC